MREYGTPEPIDFLANYDKYVLLTLRLVLAVAVLMPLSLSLSLSLSLDRIDIPVYFLMGLEDNLIPPQNIIVHHAELVKHHPELAVLKGS